MKQHPTEQELDLLMRGIVRDVSADTSLLDEIADSPTLWWGVQRGISSHKDTARSPWPPSVLIRKWLLFAVPAFASVAIAISFFAIRPDNSTVEKDVAAISTYAAVENPGQLPSERMTVNAPRSSNTTQDPTARVAGRKVLPAAAARPLKAHYVRKDPVRAATADSAAVKTDFIALSYAGNPESGQVVRVKVPSSMMVSLGLVASVEKPSSLVDAEVVVGDDGQTHAIRFIRQ